MAGTQGRVLVDDSPAHRSARVGCLLDTAASGEEALRRARGKDFGLVLLHRAEAGGRMDRVEASRAWKTAAEELALENAKSRGTADRVS